MVLCFYIIPKTIEINDILQKLLNILEISDTNKTFSLKNLDENETKQKLIIESDIKKYFLCSRWI